MGGKAQGLKSVGVDHEQQRDVLDRAQPLLEVGKRVAMHAKRRTYDKVDSREPACGGIRGNDLEFGIELGCQTRQAPVSLHALLYVQHAFAMHNPIPYHALQNRKETLDLPLRDLRAIRAPFLALVLDDEAMHLLAQHLAHELRFLEQLDGLV